MRIIILSFFFSLQALACFEEYPPFKNGHIVYEYHGGHLNGGYYFYYYDSQCRLINEIKLDVVFGWFETTPFPFEFDQERNLLIAKSLNYYGGGNQTLHVYQFYLDKSKQLKARTLLVFPWEFALHYVIGKLTTKHITLSLFLMLNRGGDRVTRVFRIPLKNGLPTDQFDFQYFDHYAIQTGFDITPRLSCAGKDESNVMRVGVDRIEFYDLEFNFKSAKKIKAPLDFSTSAEAEFHKCHFSNGTARVSYLDQNNGVKEWKFNY